MRDGTRGDEDVPGPRRGQTSDPKTTPTPSASSPTPSPTFSTPAAAPKSAKPSAIDERRERRRKRRRQGIIAATIVGIVVLVGSIGTVSYAIVSNLAGAEQPAADPAPEAPAVAEPIVFPEDEPATAAGAEPCATVNVLSSFENAEMVEQGCAPAVAAGSSSGNTIGSTASTGATGAGSADAGSESARFVTIAYETEPIEPTSTTMPTTVVQRTA